MTLEARLFVAALGVLLLIVVLRAVRTQRLRFEYSLLWILLSAGLIILAAFQQTADGVAHWVGIDYPPAFYLLLCVFVILLFLFHLSLRLSVLGDQMKDLAQQIALLTSQPPLRADGSGIAGERPIADDHRPTPETQGPPPESSQP